MHTPIEPELDDGVHEQWPRVSQPLQTGMSRLTSDRPTKERSGLNPQQARFREFIGKVGSGEHTSTGLTREEARDAMDLMLQGHASEAQMGAFLIAHRIRRPAPLELTGMLESYRAHGPVLRTPGRRALCFNVPYDGRRTGRKPNLPWLSGIGLSALYRG